MYNANQANPFHTCASPVLRQPPTEETRVSMSSPLEYQLPRRLHRRGPIRQSLDRLIMLRAVRLYNESYECV